MGIRCPRCGGNILSGSCLQCGHEPGLVIIKASKPPSKTPPKQKVDRTLEPLFIDKTGRKYYNSKPGRKKKGETRNCELCGKHIYVRGHRLGDSSKGKYCLNCFRKHILPKCFKQ